MSKQKNKSDFNAMNVAELKKIFAGTASQADILKTIKFASGNRLCSRKSGLPGQTNDANNLTLHDTLKPHLHGRKSLARLG